MSYQIKQLLDGLAAPVTVNYHAPIRDALNLMVYHDYSQLPVIQDGTPNNYYLITSDSVLEALATFGPQSYNNGLFVRDAVRRVPRPYYDTEDLFDLLEGMRNLSAALIIDEDSDQLKYIITSYDTTQYFRQWSESIMQARDVETTLKSYLREAFKFEDGTIDEVARNEAIESITSTNRQLRKRFGRSITRYNRKAQSITKLNDDLARLAFFELLKSPSNVSEEPLSIEANSDELLRSLSSAQAMREAFDRSLLIYLQKQDQHEATIDDVALDDAFAELINLSERPKQFNELTLNEYIQLLFSDYCWPRCNSVLTAKENLLFMLEGVRDTRNKLTHFREDEIDQQNRQQLKRCADWLEDKKEALLLALRASAPAPVSRTDTTYVQAPTIT